MRSTAFLSGFLCTILLQTTVSRPVTPATPTLAPRAPASRALSQSAQERLRNEVTVTLKLVQVHVTGPDGKPARDLEMSDFVLTDNGTPRTITGFEKHFVPLPEETISETRPEPARDPASLMNRKFLLLIDYESNDLEGVAKSLRAAGEFIDSFTQPGDEVALLSYSYSRGLAVHEYFTPDLPKVREALGKVLDTPRSSRGWDYSFDPDHDIVGMELMSAQVYREAPSALRSNVQANARVFADHMRNLAKALRLIPGQKNIMLFSRGFGQSLPAPNDPAGAAFIDLGRELASANAPVFSVNTTTGLDDKIKAGTLPNGTLRFLSETTGGKYFPGVERYAENARTIRDATSNYYVLAFPIAAAWDGEYHVIEVHVTKPGYKVHAQRGYFNPLPFDRLSPVEKELGLLDLALGEGAYSRRNLEFPLAALPFGEGRGGNTMIVARIPVTAIREAVGDETELISLVFDSGKQVVESRRVELDWSTFAGETLYEYAGVSLPPGRFDCRLVIRNLRDGRAAVGACSVERPDDPGRALRLYPPLLLERGREARYLRVSGGEKEGRGADISLNDIYPYPIDSYVPVVGSLDSDGSELAMGLRYVWTGPPEEAELRISAWLEPAGSSGGEQGGRINLASDLPVPAGPGGPGFFLLEFEIPEGLAPGLYVLHVRAEEPETGSASEAVSAFRI